MAHNQPTQLGRLVELLDDARNDIYIHWDLKAREELSLKTCNASLFYTPRMSVRWGDYSQTACQLLLMEQASQAGGYDYYHLLSGADLPIKTQDGIHRFFDRHAGTEFLEFSPDAEKHTGRLRYYCWFHGIYGRNKRAPRNLILYGLDRFSLAMQKALRVDRLKNSGLTYAKGANWFSLTEDCVRYILSQKEWIHRHCRFSRYSDEVFIHILVKNSPFGKKLFPRREDADPAAHLRLIDWKRGAPYTFRSSDFEQLCRSDNLFARKFNPETDPGIIELVCGLAGKQSSRNTDAPSVN